MKKKGIYIDAIFTWPEQSDLLTWKEIKLHKGEGGEGNISISMLFSHAK